MLGNNNLQNFSIVMFRIKYVKTYNSINGSVSILFAISNFALFLPHIIVKKSMKKHGNIKLKKI
jgi:disulfide oxidoreductase YuzD